MNKNKIFTGGLVIALSMATAIDAAEKSEAVSAAPGDAKITVADEIAAALAKIPVLEAEVHELAFAAMDAAVHGEADREAKYQQYCRALSAANASIAPARAKSKSIEASAWEYYEKLSNELSEMARSEASEEEVELKRTEVCEAGDAALAARELTEKLAVQAPQMAASW